MVNLRGFYYMQRISRLVRALNLMPYSLWLDRVYEGENTPSCLARSAITFNLGPNFKITADYNHYDEVELKELPPHLEYAFLEGNDKLPVIIAKDLKVEEKAALLRFSSPKASHRDWKLF
ncbi:hypothetical protein Tco_0878068 [Tanacetum coccineum]|uniref:Uncharacterized protein n=1 Tax=Tanacetum coccineum TaxID=301880 RepID=A0ABQ5C004_9ASTR